ncbi:MAG TPA: hypothetical protein VNP72_09065, partial [Longimicrobium sp.]|nr:hypothetical protein [Longimicrobium sp.]
VHVLFPDTTRADAHGTRHDEHEGHEEHDCAGPMRVHVSRLLFDASALREGATELARLPVVFSLRKRRLELSGGTLPLAPRVTDDLAPLRVLRPGFLGDAANPFITTRVVLHSGAEARAHPGANWRDRDGNVRPMSHRLTWRLEGLTEPLELTFPAIDGRVPEVLPPLYPDASDTLALFIYHVPGEELPPDPHVADEPEEGSLAHHFASFGLLVTEPVSPPVFESSPDEESLRAEEAEFERGFSPFMCMGSRISTS